MKHTITKLNLSVKSEFVPFSQSRNRNESHKSLNWRITLQQAGRDIVTTDYGAGIAHCPAYKAPVRTHGNANSLLRSQAIELECETGRVSQPLNRGGFWSTKRPILPDETNVIASLVSDSDVLNYSSFEEWAGDFGYDADSRKAESIYRQCLEIALKLLDALGESAMDKLAEAARDY